MASAGGIRAGRAFVEASLRDDPLRRGLRRLEARLRAFGASVQTIGARLAGVGAGLASLGGAALGPFGLAIKMAGDMTETASKLDVVFKGNAAAVRDWGNAYAKEVGRSEAQVQNFLADTGAVLSGLGLDPGKAAAMSKTVTGLAVDLASMFNTSDADALQSLLSGLVGESEPLKKFGLIVQETQTKAELLS